MASSDLERFLALVRRELAADDVRVAEADEAASLGTDDRVLTCGLADGRVVVVRFAEPPAHREAKQRRLAMLAGTFSEVLGEASDDAARKSRRPVAHSLEDELAALCARAAAVNAFVIDANSPVVWGAAHAEGLIAPVPLASSPRVANDDGLTASRGRGEENERIAVASRRALHAVRALADLPALRKGKHMRHVARSGKAPLLASSFAGIYLLVLVYDAPFDELRAERAIADAIALIERLVLALPPLDPGPFAGVTAMRRPRRR